MKTNSSLQVTQFLGLAPPMHLPKLLTQFPGYTHLHFEVKSSPPPQKESPAPNWNFLMQPKKDLTFLPVKKDPPRSNFSKVNELKFLKEEKFLFIKFCELLDFPVFNQKTFPVFFFISTRNEKAGRNLN